MKTDETQEVFTVKTTESLTDSAPVTYAEPQITTATQVKPLHTEEQLTPVHIEREETLRLQNKAKVIFKKLEASYSMPVEQPVQEPDGIKARRERNARRKRAKDLTPAGDEYTTIFMDAAKQRETILDMSTPDVEMKPYMDKARANGIDARQLRTFMHKVTLDKAGKADQKELERIKHFNLIFIEDFSSGDRERQIPHLDRITEEMLNFRFSPGMFEPARMAQNMPRLLELGQYLTSLQDLRRQFPWYFENQPAFKKAVLDNLTDLSPVFNTHLQNVMSAHAFDYTHKEAIQDTGPVMGLEQMSEELFMQALDTFDQQQKNAMQKEADRLALLTEEEEITVKNARPIGKGAYKYGVPSDTQVLEIIKRQSNLTDVELNMLIENKTLKEVLDSASKFHVLLNGIGSDSQWILFTGLLDSHRKFIDNAAALAESLKDSRSEAVRRVAATLSFMAMKSMSYSAVLVNLESEYDYKLAMGDERSLKTQMTDSGLGENYEGSHKREQYKTDLTDPDGLDLPVLSQSLRAAVGKEIADDKALSAIVMTVEAYEDYLRSAQVPPCETKEDKTKYPERIEKLLGELLAFNDRITARSLGYIDRYAGDPGKSVLCKALEKHVLDRDISENNFERVAELAYRLRHNDFSDTGFNAAYTGKSIIEALQNTRIAKVDLSSSDYKMAGDAASTVFIPNDTQSEKYVYRMGATYRAWKDMEETGMDIDETKAAISSYNTTQGRIVDTHKSSRDVAVARVDKLLGSGVIADASQVVFTVDGEGQTIGSKMELGQGKDVRYYFKGRDENGKIIPHIDFFNGKVTDDKENTNIDLSAPESLEKVYWLQVVDAICGSADRHPGNFFVQTDKKGIITRIAGIDNDMAFGEGFLPMRTDLDRVGMFGKSIRDFPIFSPVYDHAFPCILLNIYDKVMALTPETLSTELRGSIRDSELQTAVLRLKALQEHFQQIPHYDLTDKSQAADCVDQTKETANKLLKKYDRFKYDTHRLLTGNYFTMMLSV